VAQPKGLDRVDALAVQVDRERHERAVPLEDLADAPVLAELRALVLEVDGHLAAPALAGGFLDGVTSPAVAGPEEALLQRPPRVRVHPDGLGHHERRIEPDAELADETGGLLVALAEGPQERLGARVRDRPQVLHQLGLRHPDPEVLDREGLGLVVGRDVDLELELVVVDVLLGEPEVAQLLERVGRVAYQLAHEDLLLCVKRVDDDIEQLLDLGLELEGLWCGVGHGSLGNFGDERTPVRPKIKQADGPQPGAPEPTAITSSEVTIRAQRATLLSLGTTRRSGPRASGRGFPSWRS